MLSETLPTDFVKVAARNLLVDHLTAEVAELFWSQGIDSMLLKGPVIGDWLYADAIRAYGDADLFIARSDWDQAVALLVKQGFRDYLKPMAHPRMESLAGTAFVRGSQIVDLHCTIAGLEAAPAEVWGALHERADLKEIVGRSMAVPGRPAVLMHLALHVAHHNAPPKFVEDLRRGICAGSDDEWRQAAMLAEKLEGLAAFASGLRLVPEGFGLARSLAIEHAGSVRFDLRASAVPTAEGLHELLEPGLTTGRRASLVLAELFPKPSFMRWWTPLARRGRAGLLASYPLRWSWLGAKAPAGLIAIRRAQRRRDRDRAERSLLGRYPQDPGA